jgi:hypothetical protein
MKKAFLISAGVLFALPLVAFAQTVGNVTTASQWFVNVLNDILVPTLFALAFLVFVWGAFTTFILGANSEEVKEKGKNLMLWGLIGFFVMLSVWGLVNVIEGSIIFDRNYAPNTPTADVPG